jgi:hypothetical protein
VRHVCSPALLARGCLQSRATSPAANRATSRVPQAIDAVELAQRMREKRATFGLTVREAAKAFVQVASIGNAELRNTLPSPP